MAKAKPPINSTAGHPESTQLEWFDEEAYLIANPDVAQSLARGEFPSASAHYMLHGRSERRPLYNSSALLRNRLIPTGPPVEKSTTVDPIRANFEALMVSSMGSMLIVGWVDDSNAPLECITVSGYAWAITIDSSQTARFRRPDVEDALSTMKMHAYGFFAFVCGNADFDCGNDVCAVLLRLKNGREISSNIKPRRADEIELRDTMLTYVGEVQVYGNRQVEAVRMITAPLSAVLINHNRKISKRLVAGAYAERFGPKLKMPRASIVVCIYGKPEFLFLQSALFSAAPDFKDYEMIYICNSPELHEQLLKDARACSLIYGLAQTVVLLPGNAGFGAANNAAASYASSDRLLIVNPDVFPQDVAWTGEHETILASLPITKTKIFGALLYYDDGSLMHGGMYFKCDRGLSVNPSGLSTQRLLRVEHYGKGTPSSSNRYSFPRPVPAVTGAFMSVSRDWYEKLGGFTEDYVFGHYEDADLCLKSICAGIAPWIHDVKLWHLEGKGSTRVPAHAGGCVFNRALFSDRWGDLVESELDGPHPKHSLFSGLDT